MSQENRVIRWYAACRLFVLLPAAMQRAVSRQTLAHYRRIHRLPRDVGEDLDRRGAPFAIFRWVAWGATTAEKRARHAIAVEHHARTGHWPNPQQCARNLRAKPDAA